MTERNEEIKLIPANVTSLASEEVNIPDFPLVTIGTFEPVQEPTLAIVSRVDKPQESVEPEKPKVFNLKVASDEEISAYVDSKPYPAEQKDRMKASFKNLRDQLQKREAEEKEKGLGSGI